MAQPIVLRFKSDTEAARKAVVALGTTVATSMASVSAAAIAAHQSSNLSLGGMAVTALKAAASLTAMQYAAVAAFAAFTAAAAAGAVELEKFQKLAEKAAASNLGTTFFQAFVDGARQLRLETKQLESDLAALEKATRDKFDADRASGVSNRAGDLLQGRFRGTNDFGLSESPTLFANAQNAEERIRAVLVALRDMEGAGQRLAAIDLARQLGLDNLAERVEQGRASFSGFLAEVEKTAATGLRDGSLVNPELIRRADELKQRWERNTEELSKNVRPILDECARLATEIGNGAAWTAEQFTKLIGVVGGLVRVLRQAADAAKFDISAAQVATEANVRTQLETRLRDSGLTPLQRSGLQAQLDALTDTQRRREQSRQARAEASDVPEAPINFSFVGTGSPGVSFSAPVPNARPASAGAGSAPRASGSSAEETDKRTEAIEKFIRAQEKGIEISRIELETIGKTAVERARLTEVAKAEAQAREHGGRLTEAERDKVAALAEAQQRLRNAIEDATAAQRAWGDALQWTGDKLVDVALRGGKVSDVIKGLAIELARAALTGQGFMAKLLGLSAPAGSATGSLGGLLGLLGGVFGMGGGGAAAGGGFLSMFGLFHDGGVVGDGRVSGYAPASLFAGAPRFHGGGGLRPDELPIIGQIGEEMLTRNQRSAVAQSLAMGDAAMQALQARSGGVTMANTYHFNNVTAADRATIIAEVERRDAEVAGRIVPTVQDADRHGIEVMPYSKGM
jgi:hypothetical protein